MAAANSSGLTSPVGGAGAGREGGDGELANLGGLLSVVDSFDLTSATAAAGAGRDGAVDGEGGAGAGREDGVDGEVAYLGGQVAADVDCCGSSNPSTLMFYSPEKAAATAVAKVWKENPASSSRFTSGFVGGIDLDDEIWDVRFNLDGQDNLERCLGRSDITYLNLLAIIELEGYGINDCMYFVKEKDIGVAGMEELDGMSKVEQMIELYEEKKCINISVIKRARKNLFSQEEDEVETESDEESELNEKLIDLKKRKRAGSKQLCEDEEPEDIFCDSDNSDDDTDYTNPGSRCIVTTKMLLEHPSKNPRFHGLFYCLGASIEGFLKGCRPFFGLDGCFVKLSTGQQILCATGRDGNNNLFPIAFGLVDKEETASWSWFLTQLKYALGGEAGKFGYYTIISDRQKENREEASAAPAAPPSAAPPSAAPSAPPSATQASSAPAPAAPKRKKASAPLNPPPWKRNTGASAVATAPAAPKRKSPSAGASAAAPPSKKKAASTEASGSTTAAGPRASAPAAASRAYAAPSARASAAPSARASAAATTAVAPFKAPRPARERRESTRMKGYLTASNIDNLTMADIKKGVP
ncbi:hypothetical protein ACQ4PT_033378 [Festuca glaucescens]